MSDRNDKDRGDAPFADPSPEEIEAAEALRAELDGARPPSDLVMALKAAWGDAPDDDALDAIAEQATSPEAVDATLLREALDDPRRVHDDADFARGLRAAWSPAAITEEAHDAIVAAAIAKMPNLRPAASVTPIRRTRVLYGAGAAFVAMAASFALYVTSANRDHGAEEPLARARSTQPLFTEPFRSGDASARIDRIALARASDYRQNRFTKWGIR